MFVCLFFHKNDLIKILLKCIHTLKVYQHKTFIDPRWLAQVFHPPQAF